MPLRPIDTTTNHGTYIGDPLPTAFEKVNDNDLYLEGLANDVKQVAEAAYRKDNIVGIVGQDGGIPTGAIFQHGTGSNGRYVRFADGTQICTGKLSFTMLTGIWNWQVIYPASFVDQTAAMVQIVAGNSLSRKIGVENIDTTNCAGFFENNAGSLPAILHYIAVGRWY